MPFPIVLERLLAPDAFDDSVRVALPAAARLLLARSSQVREVRVAIQDGHLSDTSMREFVSELLKSFRIGEHFTYDPVLAALAVAVESHHSDFADEYLHDLAALECAEMTLSRHVARECLRRRRTIETTSFASPLHFVSARNQSECAAFEFDGDDSLHRTDVDNVESPHLELAFGVVG